MGGLMNLVAYGAQDIYLIGCTCKLKFKTVYRRELSTKNDEIEE